MQPVVIPFYILNYLMCCKCCFKEGWLNLFKQKKCCKCGCKPPDHECCSFNNSTYCECHEHSHTFNLQLSSLIIYMLLVFAFDLTSLSLLMPQIQDTVINGDCKTSCCYSNFLFTSSIITMSLAWLSLPSILIIFIYFVKKLKSVHQTWLSIFYFLFFWFTVAVSSTGFSVLNHQNLVYVSNFGFCYNGDDAECGC